jgi:hypothetical protein
VAQKVERLPSKFEAKFKPQYWKKKKKKMLMNLRTSGTSCPVKRARMTSTGDQAKHCYWVRLGDGLRTLCPT